MAARIGGLLLVFVFWLASAGHARGAVLYGATGSSGVDGTLYILNQADGSVITTVGALRLATGAPVGLTGLAFDPNTGTLYGSTAQASPNISGHLVRIDPGTALVTDVGAFGASVSGTLSDITFDPTTGVLYGWESAGGLTGHQLHSVNTATGTGTAVGSITTGAFGGGGLAASLTGTLFSTPDGTTSDPAHLNTVSKVTGGNLTSVAMSGQPLGRSINAMDFGDTGVLFGINTDNGGVASTRLVTINALTGVVTNVGATPDNLDAIAFLRTTATAVPEPSSLVMFGAGGLGLALLRARKRRTARR